MEGAAFEATRKDEEIAELRAQLEGREQPYGTHNAPTPNNNRNDTAASPNASRHDEFIDQDVKDILNDAIRKGQTLRDANKNMECFELFEQACQSASALLPVDSDHRGRLQLSIARSESMSPERACAILRYAMDDVLRSGLRAAQTPLPHPSQRADVVLSRPNMQHGNNLQSADEALSSLTDEMKEILEAPVYNETPIQTVSQRFWEALEESQKQHQKKEERLEHNLGKLKGDFLLARAEWEEKLNRANDSSQLYKSKYEKVKEQMKSESYMEQARAFVSNRSEDETGASGSAGLSTRAQSVASLGSGLAQHAKTLVQQMNQFNCAQPGQQQQQTSNSTVPLQSFSERTQQRKTPQKSTQQSKSYEDYSRSPQRVDV